MNTAARLESAAEPGEILIGEPTYRLVQDAVVAEPVEPLALKGKSEAVPAFRLLQVASLSPMRTRHLDAPMVGRTRERVLLQQAFERAVSDRDCQLFTVLGARGRGQVPSRRGVPHGARRRAWSSAADACPTGTASPTSRSSGR